MNEMHYRGWTYADRAALKEAGHSLEAMLKIALRVVARMNGNLHFVAGSITTGGRTPVENLRLFKGIIEYLRETEQLNLFSQMPFEVGMIEYHRQWCIANPKVYCYPILDEFYKPLFATGRFVKFHFIHGYHTSTGALWEHEQARFHKIKRRYLSRELSQTVWERVGTIQTA